VKIVELSNGNSHSIFISYYSPDEKSIKKRLFKFNKTFKIKIKS